MALFKQYRVFHVIQKSFKFKRSRCISTLKIVIYNEYSRTTTTHELLVKIKLKVGIKLNKAQIQGNSRCRENIQNLEEFEKPESVRKKCRNSQFSEEFGRSGNPSYDYRFSPVQNLIPCMIKILSTCYKMSTSAYIIVSFLKPTKKTGLLAKIAATTISIYKSSEEYILLYQGL